jgi:hypothetical protein
VHHHTPHTRGRDNVFIENIIIYFRERRGKIWLKIWRQIEWKKKNKLNEIPGIKELG